MSRNARHLPPRISFAPDGLVKRQRCLQRGGASKPEIISRNPATVIIENNREPGLGGFALLVQNKDGQERVISLPAFIGGVCLVTIDQIKLLSVDLRSLVREGQKRRIKVLDNPLDGTVTRRLPSSFFGHF